MRRAVFFLLFTISRTVEVFFLFHRRTTAKIHFLSAIGTVNQSRKRTHFAHIGRSAFCLTNFLNGFKSLLVDDCFLRVFKDCPVFFRQVNAFLRLVRLRIRLEIYCASRIFQIFKNIRDTSWIPNFRIFSNF